MLHRVPPAFGCAGLADFRAHSAQLVGKGGTAEHERDGGVADVPAVLVQLDAVSEVRDIGVLAAGDGTMFAFLRTTSTHGDAGLILVVKHKSLRGLNRCGCVSSKKRRNLCARGP